PHDERDRAPRQGLGREVVAVGNGPGHAEEERSRPDGTSIVGEVAHLDRSASDHVGRPERGDEALQIHHRPASLAAAAEGETRPCPTPKGGSPSRWNGSMLSPDRLSPTGSMLTIRRLSLVTEAHAPASVRTRRDGVT